MSLIVHGNRVNFETIKQIATRRLKALAQDEWVLSILTFNA